MNHVIRSLIERPVDMDFDCASQKSAIWQERTRSGMVQSGPETQALLLQDIERCVESRMEEQRMLRGWALGAVVLTVGGVLWWRSRR